MQSIPQFKMGTVVFSYAMHRPDNKDDHGHVVGFDRNMKDELCILVKFSRTNKYTETVSRVHPANLIILD